MSGPTTPVDDSLSAADLLSRFFYRGCLGFLVVETNRYAAKVRHKSACACKAVDGCDSRGDEGFCGDADADGIYRLPRLESIGLPSIRSSIQV